VWHFLLDNELVVGSAGVVRHQTRTPMTGSRPTPPSNLRDGESPGVVRHQNFIVLTGGRRDTSDQEFGHSRLVRLAVGLVVVVEGLVIHRFRCATAGYPQVSLRDRLGSLLLTQATSVPTVGRHWEGLFLIRKGVGPRIWESGSSRGGPSVAS
jgi:hypothetical protein